MREIVAGALRAVRALLGGVGAGASVAAWVLSFAVARRVAESESLLAGLGFLGPMALAAFGLGCLVLAWRWRWALLFLVGDLFVALASYAYEVHAR